MGPGTYTEDWVSSENFSNRHKLRTITKTVEDKMVAEKMTKLIDASTANSKLDFFRSMGLESSNCCDINCNNNNNNDNDCDLQTSYKRSCRSSSIISERIGESFDDIPEESSDWTSRRKHKNSSSSNTRNVIGLRKIIPPMRECRVTIIGEKCKICGRSFKCVRDVQIHVKKKHRKKKPRKKLVLKIGDEVISRVPIKRKHLKCLHKQKQRTIDSSDNVTSLWNDEDLSCDRISDEEVTVFDNHQSTDNSWPHLMDRDEISIVLEDSDNTSRLDLSKLVKEEEEEIQVLLKITRPLKFMEINHETPNRNEREQLISDAIQEFINMSNGIGEIVKPVHGIKTYEENHGIVELKNDNLDREERNCSFHIENEDDIDCNQEVNSLLAGNNDEYFNDETASTHSKHYRNENGDVIPDFIDYTHCRSLYNNNNGVYQMDSPFYNEARINEWNSAVCDPKLVDFDIYQNSSRSLESSVLIKEEIMLDDLFL